MQADRDVEGVTRVAIVGGGCAGMAAALELSSPDNPRLVDITVYQMGWRLGGKGASGRGVAGRIEEHGLHLWLGFYENAFRLMRQCYSELDRDPATCAIATFEQAFVRDSQVSVAESELDGSWEVWTSTFPETDAGPGTTFESEQPFSFAHYLTRSLTLAVALIGSLDSTDRPPKRNAGTLEDLWRKLENLLQAGQIAGTALLMELANSVREIVALSPTGFVHPMVGDAVERMQRVVSSQIRTISLSDPRRRRMWTILDLVLSCLRGVYRFDLYKHPQGFDAINDYDWLEWLRLNGAAEETLDSAFVRGSCYDLTFAYRDGNPNEPAFAAGVALRCALRMFFTYRGAVFWKMTAGMGDIVFAPAYEVLKQRGVKFEFFHKLTNVEVAQDHQGKHVSALDFEVQAETLDGLEYTPLVDVKGLPCWPSEPDYAQLAKPESFPSSPAAFESQSISLGKPKRVEVVRDFDMVVLGVSIDTIKDTCSSIIDENERWRAMAENVTSIGTQAAQVWLNKSMTELGVERAPGNLSGFVTPFDTWADMTSLMPREAWPESQPQALAYFCSVLPESEAQTALVGTAREDQVEALHDLVQQNLDDFLQNQLRHIWPRAADARGAVIDRHGTFISANYFGSERYVQSLPGTVRHRISPLDRSYDNLTIAGDWTHNGLDAGCVEAAVMSGLLACHAISGYPELRDIIGFDHP
jgi:uncharacterized protein with NAD-binding domain and iron-sulfur cluster